MKLTEKQKIFLRAVIDMHPMDVYSFDDEAEDAEDFDEEEDDEYEDDEEEDDYDEDDYEPDPEGVESFVMVGYVFSAEWIPTVRALVDKSLVDVFKRPVWREGEKRFVAFATPTPKGWEVGKSLVEKREADKHQQSLPRAKSKNVFDVVHSHRCPKCRSGLVERPDLGSKRRCYNPKCPDCVDSMKPDLKAGPIKV